MKVFFSRSLFLFFVTSSLVGSGALATAPVVKELEHFDYFYATSLKDAEEANQEVQSGDVVYKELPSGEKVFVSYKSGKLSAEKIIEKSYERKNRKKGLVKAEAVNSDSLSRGSKRRLARDEDPAVYKRVVSQSKIGIRYTGKAEEKEGKRLKVNNDNRISLEELTNNRRYAQSLLVDKSNKQKAASGVSRSVRVSAVDTIKRKRDSLPGEEHFLRSAQVETRGESRLIKKQALSLSEAYKLRFQPKETLVSEKDFDLKRIKKASAADTVRTAQRYRAERQESYKQRLARALENPVDVVSSPVSSTSGIVSQAPVREVVPPVTSPEVLPAVPVIVTAPVTLPSVPQVLDVSSPPPPPPIITIP